MRVVWVSHSAGVGGAELCLVEAVRCLSRLGVEAEVFVPENGPLVDLLCGDGFPVRSFPYQWWVERGFSPRQRLQRMISNLMVVRPLSSLIWGSRPDLVITHTLATPVGALCARYLKIPHLWYIREFGASEHGIHFDVGRAVSLTIINSLSSRVIVDSRAVFNAFEGPISPRKLRIVEQAIEVPPSAYRQEQGSSCFHLVLVGFKGPGKRQEDAVRAVGLLAKRGIPVTLTLVGNEEAEYVQLLWRVAHAHGVEDCIRILPFTNDVYRHIASADVALMCSVKEAFGRVTVEAMKLGKPVVGAASGATTELIRDGWNGLLYRPADPEDLAEKLALLYQDPELRRKMGNNGFEWSHRTFTPQRYGNELLRVFEEAAKDAGTAQLS